MTHREIGKVLPSVADLYSTLMQGGNREVDKREVGALKMEQWGLALDRVHAFRAAGREDKFYDIGFGALQADPLAEIRSLYQWLGRELSPDTEARMQRWREQNPRDRQAPPRDAADFGLTDDEMAERFAPYRRRFSPLLA